MYMTASLQNRFFHDLTEEKANVIVYLKNGKRLAGQIVGFSSTVVYVNNGILKMIDRSNINAIDQNLSMGQENFFQALKAA